MQSRGQMYGVSPAQVSEVFVSGGAGSGQYGTTGIYTRRFLTVRVNTGTAIKYVDSVVDGGLFKITEDGWYAASYTDGASASGAQLYITLNSTGAVDPESLSTVFLMARGNSHAANVSGCVATSLYLRAGDVIRAQNQGIGNLTADNGVHFRITKIR